MQIIIGFKELLPVLGGGTVQSDAEKRDANEERIGKTACVHGDVPGRTDDIETPLVE